VTPTAALGAPVTAELVVAGDHSDWVELGTDATGAELAGAD
jgi:hypothetical protein